MSVKMIDRSKIEAAVTAYEEAIRDALKHEAQARDFAAAQYAENQAAAAARTAATKALAQLQTFTNEAYKV